MMTGSFSKNQTSESSAQNLSNSLALKDSSLKWRSGFIIKSETGFTRGKFHFLSPVIVPVSIRGRSLHLSAAAQPYEPPIILATDGSKKGGYSGSSQPEKPTPVTEGSRVRIIQGQHLGASGTIVNIPAEPQVLATGIIALGANIKFQNEVVFVPWANLEQVA